MKIALVSTWKYYKEPTDAIVSGVVVYTRGLAKALVDRGHQVTVLASPPDWDYEPESYVFEGSNVVILPWQGSQMRFAEAVAFWLANNPHDVVEAHNWNHSLLLEQLVGGTPTVVRFASDLLSVAETGLVDVKEYTRQELWVQYRWEVASLRGADVVLAGGKKMMARAAQMEIQALEVPLGISFVESLEKVNRKRKGILISVSRFEDPRKGGEFVLDILQQIPIDIPVTVLGTLDRDKRKELVSSARARRKPAKKAGKVTWLFDTVTEQELNDLYRKSLLTVVPTKSESFGLVLLEPMAFGCPVACFDQPDESKISWPLMRLGPPMKESFRNLPKAIASVRAKGQEEDMLKCARRYLWSSIVPQYEEAYQMAIARSLLLGKQRGW